MRRRARWRRGRVEVNADGARAFCASSTQWRTLPSGAPVGLDYAGAEAAVRWMGPRWADVFGQVSAMEGEYLDALSARTERRTASRPR